MHHFSALKYESLLSPPPHNFARPPCNYYSNKNFLPCGGLQCSNVCIKFCENRPAVSDLAIGCRQHVDRISSLSLSREAEEKVKVKWSRYRPGVGRGIALLFHDCGTGRGWVVSSTPRPHFTPGKDPVPIIHEAGWAPGPIWTGGKARPHRDAIPDRPTRSHSLYRLSYPAHREAE
jgi:hypothetical protein